jgi:hypothetical protein
MSMKVAINRRRVEQRIDAFFASESKHQAARALLDTLAVDHKVWIFGGMIRDISLFGYHGFVSDIDIVIDANREDVERVISRYISHDGLTFNKFGGIRFSYQGVDFDAWCLADTWAFQEKLIPLHDVESLLRTTLLSWDAVLYDVLSRKIISPCNYFQDLKRGHLELVLRETPNETGSLIKVLRTIFTKKVRTIGPELRGYLAQNLRRYDFQTLHHYELTHYAKTSFSAADVEQLLLKLSSERSEP